MNARHTQDSPEWYTPAPFVEAARELFGGIITLDPASSAEANETVKAASYFNEQRNGLVHDWFGDVFVNPPGGKDANGKQLVPQFWCKLVDEYFAKRIRQAIWIGFSIEQLQTLQNVDAETTPLDFTICYPRKRIAFVESAARREQRGSEKGKSSPSHANYIAYLGVAPLTFARLFGQFGYVVVNERRRFAGDSDEERAA